MDRLTRHEQELIEQISDTNLRTSLVIIRAAVESIWAVDAPRIISDYTDHGVSHSSRLAQYASELLRANTGQILSDQELYLLLAGLYMHDIGMQCDIAKYPDIQELAPKVDPIVKTTTWAK